MIDTMISASDMLLASYKKQGYSLRSLAKKINKGHKTVHRYTTGEYRIPIEDAMKIARLVFDTKKAQTEFIAQCKREYKEKDYGQNQANERRKALTEARNKYSCHVTVMSGVQHGDSKRFLKIVESCKNQNEFDKLHGKVDWKYKESSADILVIVVEKAENPDDVRPVLFISSKFGFVFLLSQEYEEKICGVTIGSDEKLWHKLLGAYYKYCRKSKIKPHALFDLSLNALEEFGEAYSYQYGNSEQVHLNRIQFEEIRDTANEAVGLVKMGKNKAKLLNSVKLVSAYMKALDKQPQIIEKNRKRLLSFLNELVLLHFSK